MAAAGPQSGRGSQTADLGGTPLQVFSYRPESCAPRGILIVFAGIARNAATYRDSAIPVAQRDCLLVVAPVFDKARFPTWRYQRGGVAEHGAVLPPQEWTVALVPRLAAWAQAQAQTQAQAQEGRALPIALIGHSAGAQFLGRVAAYATMSPARIVIANPSTWVRPRLDIAAPYGFGGIPDAEAALRRYLAAPITVLLGANDTGTHNLVQNAQARAQGATRLARGQTLYAEAQQMAQQHQWPFAWHLAIVPGVGHDAPAMFASPQAAAALAVP